MPKNRLDQSSAIHFWGDDSFSTLSRLIATNWRFIVSVAIASATCAAIISFFIPNKYTAISTILPATKTSNMNSLMSLAESMPGLDLMGLNGAENSPSLLYPEILRSRRITDDILSKTYTYSHHGRSISQNLYQYFEENNPDKAADALSQMISADNNKKTGIVNIAVTTNNPELSAQIANYYLERLDNFNKYQRQTNAGQNRAFIEKRLAEAKSQLENVEESLKQLRQHNLNYYNSTDPELALLIGQLTREIEVKTQVYLTLSQQYELAAIQEKKESPIVQVLDNARPPTIKSSPARMKATFMGFLFGILFACGIVLVNRRGQANDIYTTTKLSIRRLRLRRLRHQDSPVVKEHVEQH